MLFFTIGHGARSLDELVGVLRAARVRCLVDVRRHPGSRAHPHLARASLEEEMPARGVAYVFRGEELGGRRHSPRGSVSRHTGWENASFRAYADYTDTPAFRAGVGDLVALASRASTSPLAFMCAEVPWWRCHRRIIADTLTARGHDVVHLMDATRAAPHVASAFMRVADDGWPTWGP